tara:strand:- start:1312 stop:1773 length:462 start_codon:yes stop_codon:yes gene_type:complete
MNYSKLDSIETGIIDLLNKKYNIDTYSEKHSYKNNKIIESYLKHNIITEYSYSNFVINKYLEFNTNLTNYDIDIVNMILKYIYIHRTCINSKSIPISKNTLLNTIYYYLGYNKPQEQKCVKKDSIYFYNKSNILNSLIQESYIYIFNEIVLLF